MLFTFGSYRLYILQNLVADAWSISYSICMFLCFLSLRFLKNRLQEYKMLCSSIFEPPNGSPHSLSHVPRSKVSKLRGASEEHPKIEI